MTLPRDRELWHLLLSGLAVLVGLAWMFVGNNTINLFIPPSSQDVFYYFFSGVIFSLAFIGLYGFIRTVLSFTEFVIEQDDLTSLLYENLLNDDQEGVFLKNRRGVYRLISPVAINVLGLENKVVVGVTDNELHDVSTVNKILHEDKRVLEFGETIIWEATVHSATGVENYLCKKIPCRDHRGKIVGIIGTCKNITILKSFQNLNQQQEYRYRQLFNKLPYPVLVLDSSTLQPFTFNDAMNNMLGYDKEEFSQMRMSLHVEPDELSKFKKTIADITRSNGGEFEISLVTKQRDIVNIAGYSQEISIDDKTYLHMLLYDNTETKKSTDILISSELKYRSLFEHANDAILIASPNTLNITDANQVAISFLGYKREELLLMSIQDLDTSNNHDFTQERISELEVYSHAVYEHIIKNRKGDKVDVEINAHKLNYGNEDVYQFVIRNISTRKRTEAALKLSENRYRQMFESNMAVKLVINPDSFRIEDANPAAAEFYGYSLQQLKGMDLSEINIFSREKLDTIIKHTREQNLGFYSCPHRLANGEIRFVEVRDGPMEIDGKQLFYSIIHDVTARTEAENQVLVASKMFDYSTDAVMLINDQGRVVSVNYTFSQITGYQQSEILNQPPEMILSDNKTPLLTEAVLKSIEQKGQWRGEIWHRLKDGQSQPLNATVNRIRNDSTNVSSYVVMLSQKYNAEVGQQNNIHYAELTQLPNKSLFVDRLHSAIGRAQRNQSLLGVILIDFKSFSQINADYGYDIGDKVLKAISNRLRYNTRNSDSVSHFSSDDFAILIENIHDIQQVGIVAQKLLSTLAEDYQTDSHLITLNVSMGIGIYPDDGKKPEHLISRAVCALHSAQQHNDNRFELTTPELNRRANQWLQSETRLHAALRNNEFRLAYLPQVCADSGKISAIEALIRWQNPDEGLLYPMQFLPSAQQSGFVDAIGLKVFDMAFSQYREWLDSGLQLPKLSINLCQSQIDANLPELLYEKLQVYQLDSHQISLEFSEDSLSLCKPEQRQVLQQLQSLGFHICVDDFGSTASSLNALLQCSINAIKLHPSLLHQARQSLIAEQLLHGLVALGSTQQIDIIAEGVESEDDYAYLRSLNITQMQGQHFTLPLDDKAIISFMDETELT